ncbi:glycosyltransferase family 4 protein [soil metagenome]
MVAPTSFFADYGCHVRILEEIHALQARGHTVRLATYHNGDNLPGIDIRRTVDLPWRTRLMVGSSRHKIYLDAALFFETLRQALSFRPDIIHAHLHEGALIGSVIGRVLHKPVIFDYQGSLSEEMLDHHFIRPGGLREKLVRRVERVIDRMASVIVPSGTAAEEYLLKRGVSRDRVRLLADAVDVHRFDPSVAVGTRAELRMRLGIPEHACVVMYLGLLAEYQGTSLLIDAARELLPKRNDVYFVVAGYPGVDYYAQRASTLPDAGRILFPGRVAYRDAPALLSIADVAVAPKLSTTEGNGKLFNYMAMGLPTVAIDTEPNRRILGGLGHLAPPNNPSALAAAIETALIDPPQRRKALRDRVTQHFSWQERVDVLEHIYRHLLGLDDSDQPHTRSAAEALTLSVVDEADRIASVGSRSRRS